MALIYGLVAGCQIGALVVLSLFVAAAGGPKHLPTFLIAILVGPAAEEMARWSIYRAALWHSDRERANRRLWTYSFVCIATELLLVLPWVIEKQLPLIKGIIFRVPATALHISSALVLMWLVAKSPEPPRNQELVLPLALTLLHMMFNLGIGSLISWS